MRVTNISQIRDLVNGVRQSADTSAADAASPLVTFTVDKGEASGEFIGALGDARFLLKTEGTPDVTPGSTIQIDINTGKSPQSCLRRRKQLQLNLQHHVRQSLPHPRSTCT